MSSLSHKASQDEIGHEFEVQQQHQWVQRSISAAQRIEKWIALCAAMQANGDKVLAALNKDLRKSIEVLLTKTTSTRRSLHEPVSA